MQAEQEYNVTLESNAQGEFYAALSELCNGNLIECQRLSPGELIVCQRARN